MSDHIDNIIGLAAEGAFHQPKNFVGSWYYGANVPSEDNRTAKLKQLLMTSHYSSVYHVTEY